jgi:hypothetical protein
MSVVRSCLESFKSILTSQEFGSEYELLCTQLSTQWLRVRLWGESVSCSSLHVHRLKLTLQVGLHINDAGNLQNALLQRHDIESTITQCLNSIAYLLTEIEVLRRKYELRPPLIEDRLPEQKSIRACKSLSTLSDFRRPAASLRQRMKDNQKQKSFLSITKWAMCDAKRFDEKVRRLKTLIDGLEDISQAAGIAQPLPVRSRLSLASSAVSSTETPPPYSQEPPVGQQAIESEPERPSSTTASALDPGVLAHHVALKRFVGLRFNEIISPRTSRGREKLMRLSNVQFKELRIDTYDELIRREHEAITTPFLPHNPSYHPKRNQARQKLSTLPLHRFKDLGSDIVYELERRFTSLQLQAIDELERAVQHPSMSMIQSRYSLRQNHRVDPPSPSPVVRHRASNATILSRLSEIEPDWPLPTLQSTSNAPLLRSRYSLTPLPSTMGSDTASTSIKTTALPAPASHTRTNSDEIFKGLGCSMEDPTSKVLPAALKKYNTNFAVNTYALYIFYDDVERCLKDDEKPLIIFKTLLRQGKKPMFILRKITTVPGPAQTSPSSALNATL